MTLFKSLLLLVNLYDFRVSSFSSLHRKQYLPKKTQLFAESGPPQYDKFDAVLSSVEIVADGSAMLHIETEARMDYKAGHVFALEIQGSGTTEKNKSDSSKNGGWMRGPYTISRATENSFDVLVRVVGDKSRAFASAKPGTPLRFGGRFHVPIIEGINKENTKRVVLLSTGVGIGPCIGAIEEAMKEENFPPIELYASYRTKSDVAYAEYLDSLDVKWKAVITSETGRISSCDKHMGLILPPLDAGLTIDDTHYHLIGNGQMVKEWKDGLMKAGVPQEKITVEMYHNFIVPPNDDAVEKIANSISNHYCCGTR